jgi:hypothetical protein
VKTLTRNTSKILAGNFNGRDHLGDLDVDKRIILKCAYIKEAVI